MLCNSFPKSGTHLLLQALQALPEKTHYGSFIASVPSIIFRRRSDASILRRIRAIAPGEIVPAHLYHSEWAEKALSEKQCVHYFIYRDLRDVILSESHYLAEMAWWHALHRPFRKSSGDIARMKLAMHGMVKKFSEYPDIAHRFGFYEGWVDSPAACAVRFEDLIGENRESTLRRMIEFYSQRSQFSGDTDAIVADAVQRMRPEASHTFHRGEAGRGARKMSDELHAEFQETAGVLMKKLGYSEAFRG